MFAVFKRRDKNVKWSDTGIRESSAEDARRTWRIRGDFSSESEVREMTTNEWGVEFQVTTIFATILSDGPVRVRLEDATSTPGKVLTLQPGDEMTFATTPKAAVIRVEKP